MTNCECDVEVCHGNDEDISNMIAMDAPFYQRGNIDRAPVSVPGGDDHEE